MTVFRPAPPVPPVYHGLAPELMPAPVGFGVPAGVATATGTTPSIGIGAGFNVTAGAATANGARPGLVQGAVFGVAAGLLSISGAAASFAAQVAVPPPPVQAAGTSGTYTFDPSYGEFILEAFARIQVRPSEITASQIVDARRSLNLALQTWGNRGVNLWAVQQATIDLVAGQATYTLATNLIDVLDVYYTGTGATDRYMMPISRTDYASIPDKLTKGVPTAYWVDRLITPSITIWQPDSTGTPNTLTYFYLRQLQDAAPVGGQTADIPQRFYEAMAADLAARLAQKYKPEAWMLLKADAQQAWGEATAEDRELAPIYIRPDFSPYMR